MNATKNALTRDSNELAFDYAYGLLSEELREGVDAGDYFIMENRFWRDDEKPVVKRVANGTLVKGSGRMAGTKSPEEATHERMYRTRKGYRTLIEDFIPPSDVRDNPNAIMSFKELVENLIDACVGSPQQVTCSSCGDKFQTAFKKDPSTLFKLFENLNGKAKETQQINVSSQHLSLMLNERTPVNEIVVRELSQEKIAERAQMVIEHE